MSTVFDALITGTRALVPTSLSPRLDAEVLLAHFLDLTRSSLLAYPELPLASETAEQFQSAIARRVAGEPVAYITGHKEFYGLEFVMTPAVLVPRPETESVVHACLEHLPVDEPRRMADIGTGSGAIIIATAANRPLLLGEATDISPQALKVAQTNCEHHDLAGRIAFRLGHLLEPLTGDWDVIAANLPYVPPDEASWDVAKWEPEVAVFGGGEDGTQLIREFLRSAPAYLAPGGVLVLETAHSQGRLVADLAASTFPTGQVEVRKDLAGYDRIVVIKT